MNTAKKSNEQKTTNANATVSGTDMTKGHPGSPGQPTVRSETNPADAKAVAPAPARPMTAEAFQVQQAALLMSANVTLLADAQLALLLDALKAEAKRRDGDRRSKLPQKGELVTVLKKGRFHGKQARVIATFKSKCIVEPEGGTATYVNASDLQRSADAAK